MMKKQNKKGQSTLEYVIVFTAIVAAIILAATTFIKPAMKGIYAQTNTSLTAAGTSFGTTMTKHFTAVT
jgi:uncharacterized protein (UPF0333 family)